MEKLLTAQELADILSLSVDTIWRYTRQKKIPVVELGEKQYRYEKDAVLAALSVGVSPAPVKEGSTACAEQGNYSFGDYLKVLGGTGFRFEMLEGTLVKEPSPSVHHQRLCRELGRRLLVFFDEFDPGGELFFAPLDIVLGNNVLQPDLLYVSSSRKELLRKEHIYEACDLVVEIMLPTNRRKYRVDKMEIYRKAGVPHFWLVDPQENTLETFFLENERYTLIFVGGPGDFFTHPEFPGLDLDLDRVFYRPVF